MFVVRDVLVLHAGHEELQELMNAAGGLEDASVVGQLLQHLQTLRGQQHNVTSTAELARAETCIIGLNIIIHKRKCSGSVPLLNNFKETDVKIYIWSL